MGLDVNTIWVLGCLSETGFGILLLLVSVQFPPQYRRPALDWGLSSLAFGAYYLLAYNHLRIGDFFFEVVAISLVSLAAALKVLALANLKRASHHYRFALLVPVAFASIGTYLTLVQRNISIKQFIFNIFNLLFVILLTRLAFQTPAGKRAFRSDRIIGYWYLTLSIAFTGILVHFLSHSFTPEYDYFQPRARLNVVLAVISDICVSPLFLLMVSERLNDSMTSLAMRDFLTGLYNRRAFEEICLRARAASVRNHQPYSVFLLDIDGFKIINDRYGHSAGDRVLIEVARTLRSTIREEDFVCRWGGDEFFGLLPRADEAQALLVIQRVQESLRQLNIVLVGSAVQLRVSIGIVTDRGDERDFATILSRADVAMYAAKGTGGNRYQISNAA